MSAFHVAGGRLAALFEKYGVERSKQLVQNRWSMPRRRRVQCTRHIPDGTYQFVDYLEDDLVSDIPVRIELALTIDGSDVHLDYTGTDPQVSAAFNIVTAGKPHAWLTSHGPPLPQRRSDDPHERCGDQADSRDRAKRTSSIRASRRRGSRITAAVKVLDITMARSRRRFRVKCPRPARAMG
jgi:N-methylhydantoinase B